MITEITIVLDKTKLIAVKIEFKNCVYYNRQDGDNQSSHDNDCKNRKKKKPRLV